MRLAAFFTVLFLPLPAAAQEGPIQNTIQSQIDAFLADDLARAFTFASPTIKGIFGTPENFGAMVKQGYPMVYRPAEVQMMDLREVAGNLWQRVRITDQVGAGWYLDYMMVETADGWQINAVQILPAPISGSDLQPRKRRSPARSMSGRCARRCRTARPAEGRLSLRCYPIDPKAARTRG